MKLNSITIYLFLLLIFGCNDDKQVIQEFEKKYPRISLDGYSISSIQETDLHRTYFLDKVKDTTLEFIRFFVLQKDYKNHKKGKIVFLKYERREMNRDSNYIATMFNENMDTLYSFYGRHSNIQYFLCGKYYYYYENKTYQLDSFQRDYFERHRDSIIKYKINDIPKR